jgi:hypothetical protein
MTDELNEIEILKIEEKDIIAVENETVPTLSQPRDGRHTLGKALIGVGAVLLAANVFSAIFGVVLGAWLWPLWFIVPGLLLMWPAYDMKPGEKPTWAWLAIPGAILTTLGGMFMVMSVFNHFEAWAYAWALLPISVLWSILYINRYEGNEEETTGLQTAIRVLFWIMVGLGALFELLIFNNILGMLWPLVLIGGGVYLVAKNARRTKAETV